ncbi:MAG: XdhC family protein, partial [Clostridia bacterium]|nr:XdhC family protein [Clostridia bacterium]
YVQKEAVKVFKQKESCIAHFKLNSKDVANLGMVCGGETTVYLQYMDASDMKNSEWLKDVLQAYKEKNKAWSVTVIRKEQAEGQYIFRENEIFTDDEKSEIYQLVKGYLDYDTHYIHSEDDCIFVEPLSKVSRAYVFGGGHIGYEVVPLLSKVGFYTVIIDDREEFANTTRFETADQVIKIESFETFDYNALNMNENAYIIIVTRGHLYDQEVLEEALKINASYIGMIGSKRKIHTIYENLLNKGVCKEKLKKVFAPIGLDIKAETPEEIAISITAEVIQVRAGKNG